MGSSNPINNESEPAWTELSVNDSRFDQKLLSDFGFDAPPCKEQMRAVSERSQRLHVPGIFDRLTQRGIRYLTYSNIDNLGGSIDPWLIGNHILSGRDMTVEVVRKTRNALGEWDVGGATGIFENRVQVIEGFRLPSSLAPDALTDFQTNNMYFSLSALKTPPTLPRYFVSKQIERRPSVGFEAITCEATCVVRRGYRCTS